jgi:hypothetical protein
MASSSTKINFPITHLIGATAIEQGATLISTEEPLVGAVNKLEGTAIQIKLFQMMRIKHEVF